MSEKIAGDPNSFAGASEHSQQVALMAAVAHYAKYFKENGDEARARALRWYHAVPNGGTRGGDKRSAMIAGANMKAEGARAGVYDTLLPVSRKGYWAFWIEMKAPGVIKYAPDGSVRIDPKGKLMDGRSDDQIAFGEAMATEGSLAAVFDSWWKAMRAIMWYLDFAHVLPWILPE